MKKPLITAIIISSIFASCSSNEDKGSNSSVATPYLPEGKENFWTYDVKTSDAANRDSLYVLKDTVINAKTYQKMATKTTPFGFLSNSLSENAIRIEGDKILMSGGLGVNFSSELPIDFKLNDFVIFSENAAANQQLGSTSGTVEQEAEGLPLKIDYTLSSVAQESLPTFTSPDNTEYKDVKPVKVTLKLKISTSVSVMGTAVPVTILNTQDVVTSTQYYAKNIGVVYTKTSMHYELQDFSKFGITLPIPQSASESQEEFLDKYKTVK